MTQRFGVLLKEIDDGLMLQSDLDNWVKWSEKWLLKFFYREVCKVMHLGHKIQTQYCMEQEGTTATLMTTDEERELGVIISSNSKLSAQCLKAANKAMSVLGMVKRNFPRLDTASFNIIYKGYIRPHLEFCVQAWSPTLEKDKLVLYKVQRRATKLVCGLKK